MSYKALAVFISTLLLIGCNAENKPSHTEHNVTIEQAQQTVINPVSVDSTVTGERYAEHNPTHNNDSVLIDEDNDTHTDALPSMSVTDNNDDDSSDEVILMDDNDSDVDDEYADQE